MAKLVFDRAIHIDEETGEISSYWPEYFGMDVLSGLFIENQIAFRASYMNDPRGLAGLTLKPEWIHYYLPEDLQQHRVREGVKRGVLSVGADPAAGGESDQADSCAAVASERVGNRTYLIANMNKRLPIERQAKELDTWASSFTDALYTVEDNSAKGYVWNELVNNLNDGQGSRLPWLILKPDRKNAVGSKEMRFLSMAPRFMNKQVLVPGIEGPSGELEVHPNWQLWYEQWTTFPGTHDDLLDATFWSIDRLYRAPEGAIVGSGSGGDVEERVTDWDDDEEENEVILGRERPPGQMKPRRHLNVTEKFTRYRERTR